MRFIRFTRLIEFIGFTLGGGGGGRGTWNGHGFAVWGVWRLPPWSTRALDGKYLRIIFPYGLYAILPY